MDDNSESAAGSEVKIVTKTSQPGGSEGSERITLPVHEVKRRLRLLKVPVTCVLHLLLLYARPTVLRWRSNTIDQPMLLICTRTHNTL